MTDAERRQELADFLRLCRARLLPEEVGLPLTPRRRTAGLRREEVAHLAGVGVTWYTWLEQGRDIHVSTQVLEKLAVTLRLSVDEKSRLFLLAGYAPLPSLSTVYDQVTPFLRRFLEHMGSNPAYIVGRRWDLLAWNEATCEVFGDVSALSPEERNLVRFVFTNSEIRRRLVDWEGIAQRLLVDFRASCLRFSEDEVLAHFLHDLQQTSPEFARWWNLGEVRGRQDGRQELLHPQVGYLVFDYSIFEVNDVPGIYIAVYLPADEQTAYKLEHLTLSKKKLS